MRIFPKLLLVFLLTSFVLLLLLYALMQWSVDRGMLNYANQRQMQSLQLVSENLSALYQEHNGWQAIVSSNAEPINLKPQRRVGLNEAPRRPRLREDKIGRAHV